MAATFCPASQVGPGPKSVVAMPLAPKAPSRAPAVGTHRSSRVSTMGRRELLLQGDTSGRGRAVRPERSHFANQDENDIKHLLSGAGLRYNEIAVAAARRPSATARRGRG